jgi:hypothetical protein
MAVLSSCSTYCMSRIWYDVSSKKKLQFLSILCLLWICWLCVWIVLIPSPKLVYHIWVIWIPIVVMFRMFNPPSPTQDLMVSVILSTSQVIPFSALAKDWYANALTFCWTRSGWNPSLKLLSVKKVGAHISMTKMTILHPTTCREIHVCTHVVGENNCIHMQIIGGHSCLCTQVAVGTIAYTQVLVEQSMYVRRL